MGKWIVQYWDEGLGDFVELQAVWDQTNEELDGDCYATFYIANSPENRALILQDLLVAVWFDDTLVFSGTLSGGDIGAKRIKAVIYDTVMLVLDEAEPITGVYDQKPASTIAADVIAGTGLTLGYCPSTPISCVLYNANRLDVFKFLADALNLDLYSISGTYVNLAVKGDGVVWTPSSISVSTRGLDRSKQRTKVIVRGLDCWGHHILGVAGTGTKVKTYSYNTVVDEATLNGIAAKKLAAVNTDSSGLPISVLITIGKGYLPGDSVTVVNEQYCLDGTYRIMQLNKTRTQVRLQLDKFRKTIDRTLEDLRSWEDSGIYLPGSTSWSLNLQALVGLYHLNEGELAVGKDSSPRATPVNGTIVNGAWVQGPVTKVLQFAGDGYVDIGSSITFFATTVFSICAWFSPSTNDSTKRFVAHKDGQFALYYHVNTGVVGFDFVDASSVTHTFNSDADVASVGARLFFVVTYDGYYVRMYVNGNLHKKYSLIQTLPNSANNVFLGMFLKGVLAEVMFWQRCLMDQEVTELYFFPLLRVVTKGSTTPAPTPILPPQKSGLLVLLDDIGAFTSPTITETAYFANTAMASETMTETPLVSKTPAGSETISESVTVVKGPTLWILQINSFPSGVGVINPTGNQSAGAGVTITVTATETQYWALPDTGAWLADGALVNGSINPQGNVNTYVFPAQTLGTTNNLWAIFVYGWEITPSTGSIDTGHGAGSGTIAPTGTDQRPSGLSSQNYTATAGLNCSLHHWEIDGANVGTGSSKSSPPKTDGTSHSIVAIFTHN